jgi:hypothetical protein
MSFHSIGRNAESESLSTSDENTPMDAASTSSTSRDLRGVCVCVCVCARVCVRACACACVCVCV